MAGPGRRNVLFALTRSLARFVGLGMLATGALLLPQSVTRPVHAQNAAQAATQIQHLVVIYGENVSFDHYFGTYPNATNPAGEPTFNAAPATPSVNGLSQSLLTNNPNLDNPFRIDRSHALTCDMDHNYTDEQKAFDGGKMDKFVQFTEGQPAAGDNAHFCPVDASGQADGVMGYFDGNTVTALWNYAQNFALSDNFYGTHFGPSTPGALAVTVADTAGVVCGPQAVVVGTVPACGAQNDLPASSTSVPPPTNGSTGALISDAQPFYDLCSAPHANGLAALKGQNIGDLLNAANLSWGWFQGGFRVDSNGACSSQHAPDAAGGAAIADYIPHHEPFQFFPQTANPQHRPPTSTQNVGQSDQANHQYDTQDFFAALSAGVLPAVTYVKAPAYQDGHAGYSDPLDEQMFDVDVINALMQSKFWSSTAVVLAYDDSDGWYDHQAGPIVNHSASSADVNCGSVSDGTPGRCGYGPRLPLLLISPFAKKNFVSHTLTDQSSIVRFIEDNWLGGQRLSSQSADNSAGSLQDMLDFSQQPTRALLLDPVSGEPTSANAAAGAGAAAPAAGQAGPSVTYQPGWNLVGAPAGMAFSQAANPLYTFQAGDTSYETVANSSGVAAGKGYWAYFSKVTTVSLAGTSGSSGSVSAPAGQYVMIGNPSATQTLTLRGADLSYIFDTATNSYAASTTLAPGQGAWVLSNAGGDVAVGP
jgi:phospholipase C